VGHEAYAGDRGNIKRDVFYLKPTVGTPLKPYVAMYIVRAHATVIAGNITSCIIQRDIDITNSIAIPLL